MDRMAETEPTSRTFQFFVPMLRAHRGYLPWVAANAVGVEIQDLIHPDASTPVMADRFNGLADFWGAALSPHSLPVSFHGPNVAELLYDDGRREAACEILDRSMDAAASLGARFFIVHPELGTALGGGGETFGRVLRGWQAALHVAKRHNLTLLLENTNEDAPAALRRLTASLESPSLGICFDVGHAHLRSRLRSEAWVEAFGSDLHYIHLYNTCREDGNHQALGEGEVDIEAILDYLAETSPGIRICLEMDLPAILESVPWLVARGLFSPKNP